MLKEVSKQHFMELQRLYRRLHHKPKTASDAQPTPAESGIHTSTKIVARDVRQMLHRRVVT